MVVLNLGLSCEKRGDSPLHHKGLCAYYMFICLMHLKLYNRYTDKRMAKIVLGINAVQLFVYLHTHVSHTGDRYSSSEVLYVK